MSVEDKYCVLPTRKKIPREITCYKLNSDGTYELSDAERCSVYIDDVQMAKLWNPEVSSFIRETYGPLVGVMHSRRDNIGIPVYNTVKFVLGG